MDELKTSARRRPRLSLELATAAFIAFVCLALIGVEAWRVLSARGTELKDGTVAAENLTLSLSRNAATSLRTADVILAGLVDRIESSDPDLSPARLTRLHQMLESHAAALPLIDSIGVFDAQGDKLVNSLPDSASPVNIADREYFAFHRSHT